MAYRAEQPIPISPTMEYPSTGIWEIDEEIAPRWLRNRPQIKDFLEKYDASEIKQDEQKVAARERSYAKQEGHNRALLAEIVFAEGLGQRGWLGENTSARLTSRYDDIERGADILVTVPNSHNPDEDIAFILDITVSEEGSRVAEKLVSEAERLLAGEPTRLKYFKGVERPLNRFIVGIPPHQMIEVANILRGRETDRRLEKLVQLEITHTLIYQAFRQIDLVLRHWDVPGYSATDDLDTIFRFVQENDLAIKKFLPRAMYQHLRINYDLLAYLDDRETELFKKAGTAKEKGAETLARSSSEPLTLLLTFRFDTLVRGRI